MLVTLSGIVMLVSPLQSLNASFRMSLTLSGIVILVSSLQPSNAPLSIVVIPASSGIIKSPSNFP